jgi:hypothetical protein
VPFTLHAPTLAQGVVPYQGYNTTTNATMLIMKVFMHFDVTVCPGRNILHWQGLEGVTIDTAATGEI